MKALVLRLDAPLLSFGTVMVDQHGFIDRFPGTAMLTGLIANALGWRHGDFGLLQRLQDRIRFAARWDVRPQPIVDYHTVDLGQGKMRHPGWTTRGWPEHRAGGQDARFGIHQRYRHYWADGLMTCVLTLTGADAPDLDAVLAALRRPARPLFLGRKTCLPARPLLDPEMPVAEGESLLEILRRVPVWDRQGCPVAQAGKREACWPPEAEAGACGEIRRVYDLRDWANQLPAGSRQRVDGLIGDGES
ncbi:CRISPR system Cascade subunit CasD [Methylomarinovum caldicuralii]|uniref:CRISPR system Cascade subunit CasD n=1 Tax=Methylomarinovum caldicuralii TaxID=438856 RepID=A0AAU9CRK7_9GAMM|nr:type I-E CRISPR-associated protein Cas5/CasD [Methylomarinovum caldicuralii]BCX82598.1 CRISPR system Cascade subunit CasD [Methylomarinovum caldicuralii]